MERIRREVWNGGTMMEKVCGAMENGMKAADAAALGMQEVHVPADTMILGKDCYYDLDSYKTFRNNNVVVIGSPGAGKTRGIIIPNILQCSGSYVITDPKGNLYRRYRDYLFQKGYRVLLLDFYDPTYSIGYNCITHAKTDEDIMKLAHVITYSNHSKEHTKDAFWDEAAELLLTALLAYLNNYCDPEERTFKSLVDLMNLETVQEDYSESETPLDLLFKDIERIDPDSFALRKYNAFRLAAEKTLKSILITLQTTLSRYDSESVTRVMENRNELVVPDIGRRKTAVFITVSDMDRRLDGLVNIVFTQIMQELVQYADKSCLDQHLPIPVRFLMDDFATNVTIADFPRMIASIRSRWISTMMILQAESQLTERYGDDGRTILGSCDTYVYLGGEDLQTAKAVSERADKSLKSILEMPVGTQLIFRRGEKMVKTTTFPMPEFEARRFEEAKKEFMNRNWR